MVETFGQAATAALTNAAASQGRSTESLNGYEHFVKCLRLWEAMLPKRQGDEVAGELLARGYHRMLGHLNEAQMSNLTEMVLARCKWFPTVAECKDIMGEQSYENPFFRARLPSPTPTVALPPPPELSDEEFERIVAGRGIPLSAHLDRGSIISNGDGTFRRPERA